MKKTKWLSVMLAVVMVITMIPGMAFAVEQDSTFKDDKGIRYLITSETTVSVISDTDDPYTGVGKGQATYTGEITIPETVTDEGKTYTVTEIGSVSFYRTEITQITLPDSIEKIGPQAFYTCPNLTEVKLKEGLIEIGGQAFEQCSNLKTLTIPSTVTTIGTAAFGGCEALESLTIPADVTDGLVKALVGNKPYPHLDKVTVAEGSPYEIEGGVLYKGTIAQLYMGTEENVVVREGTTGFASSETGEFSPYTGITGVFAQNTQLKSVVLPNTITSIPAGVFNSAVNMESITLQEGITTIGDRAFYNTGLKSVSLPDSVESIGASAFQGCTDMTDVKLPSGLKTIGESAFQDAYSLTSIDIPKGVTEIPDGAFYRCLALEKIILPEGLTSIGEFTFALLDENNQNNEPKLEYINIPSTVEALGYGFLAGIKSYGGTTVVSQVTDPTIFTEDAILGFTDPDLGATPTIIYPAEAEAAYRSSGLSDYLPPADSPDAAQTAYQLDVKSTAQIDEGEWVQVITDYKLPKDAKLMVSTSDSSVATATADGVVTGVKAGTADITVSIVTDGGISLAVKTCAVTVSRNVPVIPSDPLAYAKASAKLEISSYLDITKYDAAEQAVIKDIIAQAKVDIEKATSKTAIDAVTAAAKAELDAVLTTAEKEEQAAEAEKIARIKAGVQKTTIKLKSELVKGKVKLTWTKSKGYKVDGYEVFRSTKRYEGYGTKPFFTTKKTRNPGWYKNTAVKKGTRYYYKVRGVREIAGETVYTKYSNKAWRMAK